MSRSRNPSRADWTAGRSSEINTVMMAITTNSSINVNPIGVTRVRLINAVLLNEDPLTIDDYQPVLDVSSDLHPFR
jgi:hypothetical protein